jgi:formate dehydrogenase maturation protein FdhE
MVISQFKALISQITSEFQQDAFTLEKEIAEIKRKAADVQTKLDSKNQALMRLSNCPEPGSVTNITCPACFANEVSSKMVAIHSEENLDVFRCNKCRTELHIPI